MVQGRTGGTFRQVRIDTWKSIARHLGRSSRTVQRWHRDYGLPVHRLGLETGSVFAYADELDGWLRTRDQTPKSTLVEMPRPALTRGSELQPESDRNRRVLDTPRISGSGKTRAAELVAFANKLWESLSYENLKLIAKCYREASDLDPSNAEALAGLSHALMAGGLVGSLRVPEAYIAAKAALGRAVEIDAESPEARCAAAWLKMVLERDWLGARHRYDDCLDRRPTDTRALVGRALLHTAEGSPREASGLLRKAVEQNVLSTPAVELHCWSTYLAGDYGDAFSLVEEARASGQSGPILDAVEALASIRCEKPTASFSRIENLLADSPRHELLRGVLGYALASNGQPQRANEILRAMTYGTPGDRIAAPYAVALILTGLNEGHDAAQWLELSYRKGSLWSLGFPCDPILKSLRDTPSYRMFLSKVSYPVPTRHWQMNEGPSAISVERLQASGD
jgi:tetratricopeptide (TPR) repeat protein